MSDTQKPSLRTLETPPPDAEENLRSLWRVFDGFMVGVNESPCLDAGWHERERRGTDGIPCRALEPLARFHLRARAHRPARLTLLFTAPVPLLGQPCEADLYGDGKFLGPLNAEHDNWTLRHFPLPPVDTDRIVLFEIRSRTWFVPARQNPESPDCRAIACYVAAVYLEARED